MSTTIAKKGIDLTSQRKKPRAWSSRARNALWATWKFLVSARAKRDTACFERFASPATIIRELARSLKYQVLKCGPDKSCRQGPHLPIRTHGKVVYPFPHIDPASLCLLFTFLSRFSLLPLSISSLFPSRTCLVSVSPGFSSRDLLFSFVRKGGHGSECPGGSRSSSISDNNERWTPGSGAPIIPDKHTRGHVLVVGKSGFSQVVNIHRNARARHKARVPTVNFYFDRCAINMPRLVRRQITIYRRLLPRLLCLHCDISLSIFPFLSLYPRDASIGHVSIASLL